MENYDSLNLRTGDLLLFDYENYWGLGIFSYLIKKYTKSNYSHIGMIVKDPEFTEEELPKGYYLWHSDWTGYPDPQDGKKKLGVQLTHIDEILDFYKQNKSYVFLRRVHCDEKYFDNNILKKIHRIVYDKPYDINLKDWIKAMKRKDSNPQKINSFWCSALVGYIYTRCGLLNRETDWSILRPSDFSIEYNNILQFINDCYLDSEEIQIL